MGMYDTLIVLDELARLCCPDGHLLRSFQTKDLAPPSMSTYLLHAGRLYLAANDHDSADEDEVKGWRIEAGLAVQQRRFQAREVQQPQGFRIYANCRSCDPVLVRSSEPSVWGDIVVEQALLVDFRLTFRAGEPLQIEHQSGTREQLKKDLRGRGVFVLEDDDPLAVSHRTLKLAGARTSRRIERGVW